MKPIVIDASMAANWELDDEQNEAANQILDEVRHRPLITTSIIAIAVGVELRTALDQASR